MSDTDHLAAIRQSLALARNRGPHDVMWGAPVYHVADSHLDSIEQHVTALAADLAAYREYVDALSPFMTRQFRSDDPAISDAELARFCRAREVLHRAQHGVSEEMMGSDHLNVIAVDERYFTLPESAPPECLVGASGGYTYLEAVRRLVYDRPLIENRKRRVYKRVTHIIPVDDDPTGEEDHDGD